ncbi:MAG: aldehyde dehydrogenase family protein [Aliidongia sp.]
MANPQQDQAASFQTVDPATGEKGRRYEGHSVAQAKAIAAEVHAAQAAWRRSPIGERAVVMRRAAAFIRENRDRYAALMTAEMGKTVTDGRTELEKCAVSCEYFAERAEGFLARRPYDMSDHRPGAPKAPRAFVTFNPLGVVLAVMPWNFPFWQAMRFAAPNLMAGQWRRPEARLQCPRQRACTRGDLREAGFPKNLSARS